MLPAVPICWTQCDITGGKLPIVFSAVWIVLGSALRVDCIYYSIAFFGLVWLFQTIQLARQEKQNNPGVKPKLVRFWINRALPFVITLALCFGFEVSQKILMERVNPGFTEWNNVRTLVDDYAKPDYKDVKEELEAIGVSKNDYKLLSSWNCQDPEFFTQEKYEQILEIMENAKEEASQVEEVTAEGEEIKKDTLLKKTFNGVMKTNAFWIAVVALLAIILLTDGMTVACCLLLFGGALLFALYFTSIGRLIWRTEWPIWSALFCAFISAVCGVSRKTEDVIKKWNWKRRLLLVLICFSFVFQPFYSSNSLLTLYKNRVNNPNNIGRFLQTKVVLKENPYYVTYDYEVTRFMSQDKENFYYPLWVYTWLQQYPVYVPDTLRFFEVGAGENWGTLGQYMINLQPIQRNMAERGIENPFRDLVNEDVRVAVRIEECTNRLKEVLTYLREHYYPEVNYSLDYIYKDTVVGQFIDELPGVDHAEVKGSLNIQYGYDADVSGLVQVDITDAEFPDYDAHYSDAYVRLTNEKGKSQVFALMRNGMSKIITFSKVLKWEKAYTVDFVYETNGQWYIAEDCGTLQMPPKE